MGSPAKSSALKIGVAAVLIAAAVAVALFRSAGRPVDIPAPSVIEDRRALRIHVKGVDFGEVALGETRRIKVEVENAGTSPVTVLREIVSCPCLKAEMAERKIGPGETQILNTSFTGTPGKRSYVTTVVLVTDEQGPCRYEIGAAGRVKLDIHVEPETLQFGSIARGATRELEAIVRQVEGKPFKIKEFKTGRSEFSFTAEPLKAGDESVWRIKASGRAFKPGVVTDEIPIVTEPVFGANPVVLVAVEGRSDVVFAPDIAASKDGRSFEIAVTALRPGVGVSVESVKEGRDVPIEWKVEPRGDGGQTLRITFPGGMPPGPPLGEFQVKASLEEEPIPLPYRFEGPPAAKP